MIKRGPLHFSFTNAFNFLMLFYTLLACRNLYVDTMKEMTDIGLISEFLVNYQGGFVRRGLLGEILYQISLLFSLDSTTILYIINFISIACFLGVVIFFVYQFLKKRYNWWILPLGFFLANGWIIRKDYLMVLMLVAIIYGYIHLKRIYPKLFFVILMEAVLILTHEAFFFFGTPFIILLFLRDKNLNLKREVRSLFSALLIFLFLIVCYFKGNAETVSNISNSWSPLFPEGLVQDGGTIKSLGWETLSTFKFHFRVNFVTLNYGFIGLLVRPMALFFIYYLASRILFVFRTPRSELQNNDKTLLSSILVFQFIMLIPMFTVLSCDTGRVVLYWLSSSYIFFLLIPREVLGSIFPQWFLRSVNIVNEKIDTLLLPTKGFMALLILFVTITPVFFFIDVAMRRSVFGVVGTFVSDILRSIMIIF